MPNESKAAMLSSGRASGVSSHLALRDEAPSRGEAVKGCNPCDVLAQDVGCVKRTNREMLWGVARTLRFFHSLAARRLLWSGLSPAACLRASRAELGMTAICLAVVFLALVASAQDNDSYLLLQTRSRFCAPCHSHRSWGVPIYSSFPEWFESPYRERGVQCQDCHDAPDGKVANVAPGQPSSPHRDPSRVPSHNMMGEDRKTFIGSAVTLRIAAEAFANRIRVTARLTNSGAGHHFPTGQPMRNALLVIRATDARGRRLPLLTGSRLPVYAGDLAGQPGRFYAKILEEIPTNYPDRPSRPIRIPAPQWVQTRIQNDTRIPALATDQSQYEFQKPASGTLRIDARLIYRRTFPSFASLKGWQIPDLCIASQRCTLLLE